MRSKLFVTFIAALVVGAFAALPAVASAEAVTMSTPGRGNLVNGDSIVMFSNNLKFGNAPQFFACTENEINGEVTANGVDPAEVELENGGRFEGGGGTERVAGIENCPLAGTGGRITFLVKPVRFRAPLSFAKSSGTITATTTLDIELALHDPLIGGYFSECKYEVAEIEFTYTGSGNLTMKHTPAVLVANRFSTLCLVFDLSGEFEMTHEGEEVIAS